MNRKVNEYHVADSFSAAWRLKSLKDFVDDSNERVLQARRGTSLAQISKLPSKTVSSIVAYRKMETERVIDLASAIRQSPSSSELHQQAKFEAEAAAQQTMRDYLKTKYGPLI